MKHDFKRELWNKEFVKYVMTRMTIDLSSAKKYAESMNNAYKKGLSPEKALIEDWKE